MANVERKATREKIKGKQRFVFRVIGVFLRCSRFSDTWNVLLILKISAVVTGDQCDFVVAV